MRHLKSYKIFESISDVRDEIESILTELYHLGYEIDIYSTDNKNLSEVKVFIEKDEEDNHKYKPSGEFVDCLQHLISYADEQGFIHIITTYKNSHLFKSFETVEEVEDIVNYEIDYIKITLRK